MSYFCYQRHVMRLRTPLCHPAADDPTAAHGGQVSLNPGAPYQARNIRNVDLSDTLVCLSGLDDGMGQRPIRPSMGLSISAPCGRDGLGRPCR